MLIGACVPFLFKNTLDNGFQNTVQTEYIERRLHREIAGQRKLVEPNDLCFFMHQAL